MANMKLYFFNRLSKKWVEETHENDTFNIDLAFSFCAKEENGVPVFVEEDGEFVRGANGPILGFLVRTKNGKPYWRTSRFNNPKDWREKWKALVEGDYNRTYEFNGKKEFFPSKSDPCPNPFPAIISEEIAQGIIAKQASKPVPAATTKPAVKTAKKVAKPIIASAKPAIKQRYEAEQLCMQLDPPSAPADEIDLPPQIPDDDNFYDDIT